MSSLWLGNLLSTWLLVNHLIIQRLFEQQLNLIKNNKRRCLAQVQTVKWLSRRNWLGKIWKCHQNLYYRDVQNRTGPEKNMILGTGPDRTGPAWWCWHDFAMILESLLEKVRMMLRSFVVHSLVFVISTRTQISNMHNYRDTELWQKCAQDARGGESHKVTPTLINSWHDSFGCAGETRCKNVNS